MPHVRVNGIRLAYERRGHGEPVVLIMGSSAGGRVWTMHQTPALTRAGYETITFDHRGVAGSDAPPGKYSLEDMIADTLGLIEALAVRPCRLVGASMGAVIAQELAARRADLVRSAVLIATQSRADAVRRAMSEGDRSLVAAGIRLPASYDAANTVIQMLSPATLNDDAAVSSWLDIFELSGHGEPAGGQAWIDLSSDRRETLRRVGVPCRVIGFTDDLVCPSYLGAEVADAIPDCDFVEISRCGHLGYLERPDEVNAAIIEFFNNH